MASRARSGDKGIIVPEPAIPPAATEQPRLGSQPAVGANQGSFFEVGDEWRPASRGSKEKLRLKLYFCLAFVDSFSLLVAFLAANAFRFGAPFHEQGMNILVVLLPVFLGTALNAGAYSLHSLTNPRMGIARAMRSLFFALAALLGTVFYLKAGGDFSRLTFGVGSVLSFVFLGTFRWMFGQVVGQRYSWSFRNEVLFVDGVPVFPQHQEIVIFADEAQLRPSNDDPLMLDRLGHLLRNCDRVILACPPEKRFLWSRVLKGIDVEVEILAPEIASVGALQLRSFHGKPTLLVSCGPLGLRDRAVKRAFDLAVAIAAIIALLPVFILAAAAIKLETKGPIFFRQDRVGRGNRLIQVLKFRSMRAEQADANGVRSASRDDERITRVGRFIRRTSIDELPQILNVLKGDMSIVGPRPHALSSTAEQALFWQIDPRYSERHIIKPGITGLAQVRGYRGATLTRSDLTNRLQADLEYLAGWSIWRDLRILFRTARVLVHPNAF